MEVPDGNEFFQELQEIYQTARATRLTSGEICERAQEVRLVSRRKRQEAVKVRQVAQEGRHTKAMWPSWPRAKRP